MKSIDLNQVQIASPCKAQWSQMKGDDRKRFCQECRLNVFNVAGLSKAEAEALILRSLTGERVCVRLTQRADGTILTNDCPVGLRLLRRARVKFFSAMAAVYALAFGITARSETVTTLQGTPAVAPREMLGKIAVPTVKPVPPKVKPAPPKPEDQGR